MLRHGLVLISRNEVWNNPNARNRLLLAVDGSFLVVALNEKPRREGTMPVEGQPSGLKQSSRPLETVTPRGNATGGWVECSRTRWGQGDKVVAQDDRGRRFNLEASTVFGRGPANWILCTRHSFLSANQPILFFSFCCCYVFLLFRFSSFIFPLPPPSLLFAFRPIESLLLDSEGSNDQPLRSSGKSPTAKSSLGSLDGLEMGGWKLYVYIYIYTR